MTMSYEDFMEKLPTYLKGGTDLSIQIRWAIGGQTGGSCWNDCQSYTSIYGDPEPEFEEFDKVLKAVVPTITFIQYKFLYKEVVVSGTDQDSDYYGNHTEYATKTVHIRKLYQTLKNMELL